MKTRRPLTIADLEKRENLSAMDVVNVITDYAKVGAAVSNHAVQALRLHELTLSKRQKTRLRNSVIDGMVYQAERGYMDSVVEYARILLALKNL